MAAKRAGGSTTTKPTSARTKKAIAKSAPTAARAGSSPSGILPASNVRDKVMDLLFSTSHAWDMVAAGGSPLVPEARLVSRILEALTYAVMQRDVKALEDGERCARAYVNQLPRPSAPIVASNILLQMPPQPTRAELAQHFVSWIERRLATFAPEGIGLRAAQAEAFVSHPELFVFLQQGAGLAGARKGTRPRDGKSVSLGGRHAFAPDVLERIAAAVRGLAGGEPDAKALAAAILVATGMTRTAARNVLHDVQQRKPVRE